MIARVLILVAASGVLWGGEWPQWRGPAFTGVAPEENPTVSFAGTNHVRWAVAMPGPSAATPAVWGEQVFVSSVDRERGVLVALAYDANTGALRWQHDVAQGVRRDDRSNYASASPVTDGRRVWFYYSTGDLVAMGVGGEELWRRNLQADYGEFAFLWTFASTPLLFEGRLYLQVLQRDVPVGGRGRSDGPNDSYVLALSPDTGRELWRQVRPSEARQESLEAFSSPIPLRDPGRPEVLVAGGDCVTGHDPATGRELWRWGTWNEGRIPHWRLVPSPVVGSGLVLVCAPKGGPVYAVRAGASGTLAQDAVAWKSADREVSSDVPTPLFLGKHFYVLNGNRRTLSCVDPATGVATWTGALEGRSVFEASPTAAGGRIYCLNHRGELFVVAADPTAFRLIEKVELGTEEDTRVRSSVAIAGGRVYVRTDTRLLCFGERR